MRKNIVAGNWKMNNDYQASNELSKNIVEKLANRQLKNTRVIVAPTFVNLQNVVNETQNSVVEVAAQNMHQNDSGAFTGEISADMIKSVGVNMVILGHSERREYFHETDEILAKKVSKALEKNMEVIFCFGEVLQERKSEKHFEVVKSQLSNALFHLENDAWKNIILAYEPVWAIGTGETASPDQAQEMHSFIRSLIDTKYGNEIANEVSILYGGSVKPSNAKEIFSKEDVDGGLIGGASLNADDFVTLIELF